MSPLVQTALHELSGTELAILNRESGDSETCDSNRVIPRSRLNIDRLPFGLAILNRFPAIPLCCDSTHRVPPILGVVR